MYGNGHEPHTASPTVSFALLHSSLQPPWCRRNEPWGTHMSPKARAKQTKANDSDAQPCISRLPKARPIPSEGKNETAEGMNAEVQNFRVRPAEDMPQAHFPPYGQKSISPTRLRPTTVH